MSFSPHFLGIFTNIYGSYDAMTISKALLVALVGFSTVVLVLAVIALFIKFIAFIFSVVEKKSASKKVSAVVSSVESNVAETKKVSVALPDNESQGNLELIGVDEATAAMLMALVSYKTDIPLNRLAFRSIKLVEEEK